MYFGYGGFSGFIYLLPAMLFAFYAQNKVKSTFNRYLKVRNTRNYTGSQVARAILDRNGLKDIGIEHIGGYLSDHYDPRKKVLRLSNNVYNSNSIAAISVAAHEVGHAIQHSKGYMPLTMRNQIAPIASFASQLVWPLVLGGFIFNASLLDVGILLYLVAIAFHVITLPVEFNASSRALRHLTDNGFISSEEIGPSKSVLNAAALTYVAATAVSLAQLLRLLALRDNRR